MNEVLWLPLRCMIISKLRENHLLCRAALRFLLVFQAAWAHSFRGGSGVRFFLDFRHGPNRGNTFAWLEMGGIQ